MQELEWSTHRQPQNIYQYIPPMSCHPKSVFSSFVQGELQRISMTNKREADEVRHRKFFKQRLLERGYSQRWVDGQIKKHLLKKTARTTSVLFHAVASKSFYIKLVFSRQYSPLQVTRLLNKHSAWLRKAFGQQVQVRVAWSSQRNIFRLLYSHNWRQSS